MKPTFTTTSQTSLIAFLLLSVKLAQAYSRFVLLGPEKKQAICAHRSFHCRRNDFGYASLWACSRFTFTVNTLSHLGQCPHCHLAIFFVRAPSPQINEHVRRLHAMIDQDDEHTDNYVNRNQNNNNVKSSFSAPTSNGLLAKHARALRMDKSSRSSNTKMSSSSFKTSPKSSSSSACDSSSASRSGSDRPDPSKLQFRLRHDIFLAPTFCPSQCLTVQNRLRNLAISKVKHTSLR